MRQIDTPGGWRFDWAAQPQPSGRRADIVGESTARCVGFSSPVDRHERGWAPRGWRASAPASRRWGSQSTICPTNRSRLGCSECRMPSETPASQGLRRPRRSPPLRTSPTRMGRPARRQPVELMGATGSTAWPIRPRSAHWRGCSRAQIPEARAEPSPVADDSTLWDCDVCIGVLGWGGPARRCRFRHAGMAQGAPYLWRGSLRSLCFRRWPASRCGWRLDRGGGEEKRRLRLHCPQISAALFGHPFGLVRDRAALRRSPPPTDLVSDPAGPRLGPGACAAPPGSRRGGPAARWPAVPRRPGGRFRGQPRRRRHGRACRCAGAGSGLRAAGWRPLWWSALRRAGRHRACP